MRGKLFLLTSFVLALLLVRSASAQLGQGHILVEWWLEIGGGNNVSDLTGNANYPDNPTGSAWLDSFEVPRTKSGDLTVLVDNYGARLRGYLYPPATGDYTFWVTGDNGSDFLISTDDNPANATRICFVPDGGYTGATEYTKYPEQKSNLVSLQAGKTYYVEVLFKEGGGGDGVAVAWGGPTVGAGPALIGGQYLSVFIRPVDYQAKAPSPANGAVYSQVWASLGWTAGYNAVTHDVYISENADDVAAGTPETFRGNQASTFFLLGVGMPGDPYPTGLVPGTTYYWRIDEVEADGTTKHQGSVWSFFVPPQKAYAPSPRDGGKYVDTGVTLTWGGGLSAKVHYVYFGDNADTVANATVGIPSATTSFTPPGPLASGKTYYWRVDEANPPITVKGDVWRFTTIPNIPISDPNMVAWYRFEVGEGTRVIDFSGHDNDATISGNVPWVNSVFNMGLEFTGDAGGYVELPASAIGLTNSKGSVTMWINSSQTDDEGHIWYACDATSGDGFGDEDEMHVNMDDNSGGQIRFVAEGNDGGSGDASVNVSWAYDDQWIHVAATWDETDGLKIYINGILAGSTAHNNVGNLKSFVRIRLGHANGGDRKYDGLIDDFRLFDYAISDVKINEIMTKGEDPRRAGILNPSSGAKVPINLALPLSWSAGESAAQHDVYFGTDRDALANADAADTTGIYRGRQTTTSYTPPEGIQLAGGPYYWRIDEVAADGSITAGGTWSFTVADYVLVDGFESYNDIPAGQAGSNLVYEAWKDGYLNPNANGSTMGYPTGASMETATVHGGNQAVPLLYNNSPASFSEVQRALAPQNWTSHGVQTLSLWFFGDVSNVPGQLYVKVNGVKVAYGGEADNLRVPAWQVWNIDLASVGTNLQSVTSLAIGVDGSGATGALLLDDIRLYRQAEAPVGSGVVDVPRTSVPPLIDGQWDAFWNSVTETRCLITDMANTSSETPEDSNDLSAIFKAAYDNSNFYFFVEVQDSVIDYEFSNWQGDGVEIYFDGDISRGSSYDGVNDNQIRITVDDVVLADIDSSLPIDGATFKVLLTDLGYNIEASFPLARLGISPLVPNKIIGFEVQINDNDNSGGRQTMLRWYSDDNNSWQDPSLFGVARLVSRVVGN